MFRILSTTIAAACAAVLLAQPAAAHANPIGSPASVTIDYSDLDLTTDRGANRMLLRVRRAASQVCGEYQTRVAISLRTAANRCTQATIADTLERLNAPVVSARYYEGRQRNVVQAGGQSARG